MVVIEVVNIVGSYAIDTKKDQVNKCLWYNFITIEMLFLKQYFNVTSNILYAIIKLLL